MKPYYQITAIGPQSAEVRLYGQIGESFWTDETINARRLAEELAQLKSHALTVYINSPGGSVMEATAIYNALQRHPQPVNIIIDGWALSAASLIAMAGQSTSMGLGSLMMLHNPRMPSAGTAEELRKAADLLDTVRSQMVSIYAKKTGAETWFSPTEALKEKLANAITEQTAAPAQSATTAFKVPSIYAHYLKENSMNDPTPPAKDTPVPVPPPTPPAATLDAAAIEARAIAAERQRASDIRAKVALATKGLPSARAELTELQEKLIAEGVSIADAISRILDKIGEGSEPLGHGQGVLNTPVQHPRAPFITHDARDKFITGASEALLIRAGVAKNDPKNEFRPMRLTALAESCLVRAGLDIGRYPNELALVKAAITHTSSDFPVLLENTLNKTLLDAYSVASDTWRQWCAVGTVSDFRPYKRLRMGSFGNLDALGEGGEYKHKAIPDATAETVSIGTKANTITLTRQAIINDDLGGFIRIGQMLARAAARSIEKDAYDLLVSNPVLDSDNKALFHTDHGNLHTGSGTNPAAAITMTSLDAARSAIKIQKDRSGNDYIGITEPFLLLCPVAKAGAARVANESEFDPDTANKLNRANITRGIFKAIIDTPYLSGNAWYLLADPAQFPTLEVLFLNGVQTPFTEQEEKTNVDGVTWKVRLDYGVNVVDYVGAFKNDGA
jgi:ATP-dependent protease ClpP protease subunit